MKMVFLIGVMLLASFFSYGASVKLECIDRSSTKILKISKIGATKYHGELSGVSSKFGHVIHWSGELSLHKKGYYYSTETGALKLMISTAIDYQGTEGISYASKLKLSSFKKTLKMSCFYY